MLFYFAIIALVCAAFGASPRDSNNYVDSVLNNVYPNEARDAKMTPAKFPNFETEFKDKVAFVSVKVKNTFKNGTLEGLLNITRARDCGAPFNKPGNNIAFNCTLSLDNLYMEHKVDIKYGKLPTVEAKVKTDIDRTLIAIEVTANRGNNYPTLTVFQVTNLGQLRNTFTGLGPLNKQLKALESGFNTKAQRNLEFSLNVQLKDALSKAVFRRPLPLP